MDCGIALINEEGFITFANMRLAQQLRVPRTEIVGRSIKKLIRLRVLPKMLRKQIHRMYREMYLYRSPYKEIMDDKGRHFFVTATYGEELDGEILISVKDVTEFKQIEQSVYHNDKLAMLGKIAASIAHEIRNPLTSIRGFIQLLEPDLKHLGKEDYAKIIISEIDRANDIIYEFLNSSKPTAPSRKKIQVAELIQEAALLCESEALLKGCEIVVEPIDPSITFHVDVKQIKQVILNLLKNALEAITTHTLYRKGMIWARVKRVDACVVISIQDNGSGMDKKTLSKLFDPFFSLRRRKGRGLACPCATASLKNHSGTIKVESELDKGTEFHVYLPVGGTDFFC